MNADAIFNWRLLDAAEVAPAPFPHLIVPNVIAAEHLDAVDADYPDIASAGSFPRCALRYGPAFARLLETMEGETFAARLGGKFNINLADKPTMLTVRGKCRPTDGQIHLDSKGKIITVLLYMNDDLEGDGGRLRLLNRPDDIEDYFAEIPPARGTLLAFLCADNAWHGHKSFDGRRRAVQLNWVRSRAYLRRERRRHIVSATVKKIGRWLGVSAV